jgi:hypothetical protein
MSRLEQNEKKELYTRLLEDLNKIHVVLWNKGTDRRDLFEILITCGRKYINMKLMVATCIPLLVTKIQFMHVFPFDIF